MENDSFGAGQSGGGWRELSRVSRPFEGVAKKRGKPALPPPFSESTSCPLEASNGKDPSGRKNEDPQGTPPAVARKSKIFGALLVLGGSRDFC
ncbi:hypothetical protein PAAG_04299 [Paracoccidioides lutzii Pb01]|uniref:Uncharacterized protein n=1 Tax=Paracoccidioides lutzii (strain ATCC MYA-826 / Pb01) TaxID=502779 RepID=C1H0K5_PARBA|nr:hypothetical protein PAAG_04299 [Paracoccidioides lutzii Pb01]EEH33246.2 hypothetical protein PAAG_04299 [Paracoccidioides lutzii Pb01]